MQEVLIVRYGEIYLKGDNRPFFERILYKNMRKALHGMEDIEIRKETGRFYITSQSLDAKDIIEAIQNVFGIATICVAAQVPSKMDAIETKIVEIAEKYLSRFAKEQVTFKVETKRTNKLFPMTSIEISRHLGGVLLDAFPDQLTVDVHEPDFVINVEVREVTYLIEDTIQCLGGMPVSSAGKGLVLLSGGIDSPVAAFCAAKRGIHIECVHFHSFPYTSERAKEKVIDLLHALRPYCGRTRMFIASMTEIQREIHEKCPEELMTILTRRFMMRIADAIAKQNECKAIFTGESIGQVASQTLDSMIVTTNAADTLILRPLICMDKSEIIKIAEEIGTYEISIQPYEDCCTVFQPKHPSTKPQLESVLAAEAKLEVEALVQKSISEIEVVTN